MNIRVMVVTHKDYWMPVDSIYMPIQAGNARNPSTRFTGDDTGDNISEKNPGFCELTGLYWAWKNLEADYIGLSHYRRHFTVKSAQGSISNKRQRVVTSAQLEKILRTSGVVVPRKRRYYIETNRSHYNHAHKAKDLNATEQIVAEIYPDYLESFRVVMNRTWAHMFNMFIMRYDYFSAYCQWLFDILFRLEEQIDLSGYSASEARVFGYISERLLDVWLEKNRIPYTELNVVFLERQNWLLKGGNFLKRKFFPKRETVYEPADQRNHSGL